MLFVVVLQLLNKVVFVVSFVGNNGTFIMGYKAMVMDVEFLYHLAYVLTSTLGLFVHELFYSILVRTHAVTHTQSRTHSERHTVVHMQSHAHTVSP